MPLSRCLSGMCYSEAMRATRAARHQPLQPETVVQAALELLDTEGLENVTLRRLAAKLGVQAPALYWHFKNKQDILDDMAQAILLSKPLTDALAPPADPGAWAEWLRQMAHALRQALLSRREGARVVAGAGLGRAPMLAELAEQTIRVLHAAGFDLDTANRTSITIEAYTFGFVIEEQAAPPPTLLPEAQARLAAKFPMIAAAMDTWQTSSPAESFDWGIRVILQGLQTSRQDAPPAGG